MRGSRLSGAAALFFCLLFLLTGMLWISRPGLQNDEALFASGMYGPFLRDYYISIFQVHVPTMVMTYVGALKGWIYQPVFALWDPSAASIRFPVLLIGAATVSLFYVFLRRVASERAALAGCALLATDSIFLFTTRLDWGPVALQHLLLVGGCAALVLFQQRKSLAALGVGFFIFGLGMWDKALFSWMLIGLACAGIATFPRVLLRALTVRHVAIATLAFLLGSLPLLIFNLRTEWSTFRGNTQFSTEGFQEKAELLRYTLSGEALFGYVTRESHEGPARQPETSGERLSVWLSDAAGHPRTNLLLYATALSLLCLPWLWFTPARKPLVFALVFTIVTWLQMAFTKGAGAGAHHTVLLWPFPLMFIAITLDAACRRAGARGKPLFAIVLAALVVSNLLVTNHYYAQLIRYGGGAAWSEAIYPLSDSLHKLEADEVHVLDWGMLNSLRLLHEGELDLRVGSDPVMD
ncbi:MAG: glycosyltransferase family 39 protein, partial [Bryobacteraceae bacterium]